MPRFLRHARSMTLRVPVLLRADNGQLLRPHFSFLWSLCYNQVKRDINKPTVAVTVKITVVVGRGVFLLLLLCGLCDVSMECCWLYDARAEANRINPRREKINKLGFGGLIRVVPDDFVAYCGWDFAAITGFFENLCARRFTGMGFPMRGKIRHRTPRL